MIDEKNMILGRLVIFPLLKNCQPRTIQLCQQHTIFWCLQNLISAKSFKTLQIFFKCTTLFECFEKMDFIGFVTF